MNEIKKSELGLAKKFVSPVKSKLPVMPLAVILPSIGDTARLSKSHDFFQNRLSELQEEGLSEDESEALRKINEESMLQQVLSWLTMGEEK